MNRGFVVIGLIAMMLGGTAGLAQAHEVSQWSRYSNFKDVYYTNDYNTAVSKLNNYDHYKGKIWASGPTYDWRVRYRQVAFDHRSTTNWLGFGYSNAWAKVNEAQRALAYLGYNSWDNVDGYWGSNTAAAVRGFQSANSLSADGVVGRVTWNAMVYRK